MRRTVCLVLLANVALANALSGIGRSAVAADLPTLAVLEKDFSAGVRPLLQKYCFECHAQDTTEADIDLGADATTADVRKHLKAWIKVRAMLDSRQMPPKDAKQPSDAERTQLVQWVRGFLTHEAQKRAGDPGPVVLRRLNNSEYAYTIRDLSGVATLDPTREFPVDGGSGEGFTNTGSGQGMSPALVQKYLDAAKDVATHAVLTPTGVRFSPHRSRRDQTDELLAQIQAFYRQFTEDGGGTAVDLHGIKFDTNQGGRLPLRRYLAALLAERDALRSRGKSIAQLAAEKSLSPKYLTALWTALETAPNAASPSPLLDPVRITWRDAKADPGPLVTQIESSHKLLWKNNSIGHIGREGGPKSWLEPLTPFVAQQEIRLPLPNAPAGQDVTVYLSVGDAGDGRTHDVVVWQRPRIEFKPAQGTARPPVLLRDVRWFAGGLEKLIAAEAARSAAYLEAVRSVALPADRSGTAPAVRSLNDVASERRLRGGLLERWVEVAGVRPSPVRQLTGHYKTTIVKGGGYDALNGWGSPQTPSLMTNRSDAAINVTTVTFPPRGVTVHPSPTQEAFVAWRSPLQGTVRLTGKFADADDKCGNGAEWRLERLAPDGTSTLAAGQFDSGKAEELKVASPVGVKPGDMLAVFVGPIDKNHACDTTHVVWQIAEVDGQQRTWDLAKEIVDRVLEGNPLADSFGHRDVWHFGATGGTAAPVDPVPAGSTLARWREAVRSQQPADAVDRLAGEVQQVLTSAAPDGLAEPDRKLRASLLASNGPLGWASLGAEATAEEASGSAFGLDRGLFGRGPDGSAGGTAVDATSLSFAAPHVLEIKLPGGLFAGGELVGTVTLHPTLGRGGSVQVKASTTKPAAAPASAFSLASTVLVGAGEQASPLQAAVQAFRDLFPPSLCYARIVPVDEVVTLQLFYREDDLLRRLMLDERQAAELDRLWDELFFVAQEPIALSVSYEQIYEFATQDRPDLVKAFAPLRKPIFDRADAFRRRLVETEPVHVDAVLRFADQAWRRPLVAPEQQTLRDLYAKLRAGGLDHDPAIRLLLARVLTSPAFLYKFEQPGPGKSPTQVSDLELAARLSYFLGSTAPDAELRAVAQSGRLRDDRELLAQTKRLLAGPHVRRLAVEFACQWLHVRDFDRNNDKNEALFPEFANVRDDMYEETVLFLEDLFRHDGSILTLLDADHTFVNDVLAKHYGLPGVTGGQWRRVEGLRGRGRGGLLGMATVLASQSGASRTSPILRGNWVYETLLGEKLPRPPANVPRLPDEPPAGLTERQLIEKHSSEPACAKCHVKIDPYGFALERFDPIGRLRAETIDVKTKLADGVAVDGLAGLRTYLQTNRRTDFVRQFCRKLLGYALGRETQLSDEPLLAEMQARLESNGQRFHVAVEAIVLSRQFCDIRGAGQVDE